MHDTARPQDLRATAADDDPQARQDFADWLQFRRLRALAAEAEAQDDQEARRHREPLGQPWVEHQRQLDEHLRSQAERAKLRSERHKLDAETSRLDVECKKVAWELFWQPMSIFGAFFGTITSVGFLALKFLDKL